MNDPVFRKVQQDPVELVTEAKQTTSGAVSKIEVPFTDYSREHGKPFTVDLFSLGENWTDGIGGFQKEVGSIENYLMEQIENREIDNNLSAIKRRIKEIEKITGVDKEDRTTVKLEVIAEYMKFLSKKSDIHKNITRYGSN